MRPSARGSVLVKIPRGEDTFEGTCSSAASGAHSLALMKSRNVKALVLCRRHMVWRPLLQQLPVSHAVPPNVAAEAHGSYNYKAALICTRKSGKVSGIDLYIPLDCNLQEGPSRVGHWLLARTTMQQLRRLQAGGLQELLLIYAVVS